MSTLHIVNKVAAWADCAPLLAPGDQALLIEDGVYAAREIAEDSTVSVQALAPDVKARGLVGLLPTHVALASHDDFVRLVCAHDRCVTWSR